MGGAVSSGCSNDDLIDNLLEADYIKTSLIERVFRAVDRAEYFLPEARNNAYKDLAWKSGNLHLSAPCIYSEVMEGLNLEPGLSFLNLGSGTGYLSTMVGLILGTNGINHGIEIHEDVIQYATKKLEEFKKYSGAIDEYDFCEPKFVRGNCLCLTSECTAVYDRIYCGAACPEQYESYMKNLLKIGGVLVMPINDQLLQIQRNSETDWSSRTLLPVSFASLVVPHEDFQEWVGPIDVQPLSLQVLCRAVVLNILRKNIEIELPPVTRLPPVKASKKKRALRGLVVPVFDDEDSSEEERQVRLGGERNRDAGRATFRRDDDNIFSFFFGIGNRRGSGGDRDRPNSSRKTKQAKAKEEAMETEGNATGENSKNSPESSNSHQVRAVIEHHPNPENNSDNNQNEEEEHSLETINEISDVLVECLNVLRRERANLEDEDQGNENEEHEQNGDPEQEEEAHSEADAAESADKPGTSARTKSNGKREKFDSGLGDEIIEAQDSSDDDDDSNMKLDVISSCDEDHTSEKRHKRGTNKKLHIRKFRRIDFHRHIMDTSSSENEDDSKQTDSEMKMYQSPFTAHMKSKIQQLPLPPILKRYLNFYRDF